MVCASAAPASAGIGSAATDSIPNENAETVAADGTRMSKIKVALVVGYNGSRFGGLQRNPGQFSIEDVLEEAVHKVGGIADSNYHDFHKISWTRAARTDKGVHATGNVVSFKMIAKCVELEDGSTVGCAASPYIVMLMCFCLLTMALVRCRRLQTRLLLAPPSARIYPRTSPYLEHLAR